MLDFLSKFIKIALGVVFAIALITIIKAMIGNTLPTVHFLGYVLLVIAILTSSFVGYNVYRVVTDEWEKIPKKVNFFLGIFFI